MIWVTRAKENLQYTVVAEYWVPPGGKLVTDEVIGLHRNLQRTQSQQTPHFQGPREWLGWPVPEVAKPVRPHKFMVERILGAL